MDVEGYLKSKGWKYNEVGDQFQLKVCPFCKDDKGHFYINKETGQYFCHKGDCQQAGGLYSLKRYLGDTMKIVAVDDLTSDDANAKKKSLDEGQIKLIEDSHLALFENRRAMSYLAQRRFTEEAIRHFKLGVIEDKRGKWLTYPYIENGVYKNVKLRTLPPAQKAFRRFIGGESLLFNKDVTSEDYKEIFVLEGEGDCVALWSTGIKNVVSIPDGAGSGIKNQIIEALDRFQKIYLVYDTDPAGEQGLLKMAKKLGLERTYRVRLPTGIKDVNDYLKEHTPADFLTLVASAERIDVEDVKPLAGVIQDVIVSMYANDGNKPKGLPWPWPSVEAKIGQLYPGDLVVIGGKPGVGKTTMAMNLLMHQATNGIPSLLFELEMRPERMIPRIVSAYLQKPTEEVFTLEVMGQALEKLKNVPFYFAYKWKKPEWNVVEDTTKMCIQRYDIQFMVFDNLHFLCRKEDRVEEVSIMIQHFKDLATECGIPVVVIARPKKLGKKIIDAEDLAWSADIHGDADGIVLIHRDRREDVDKQNVMAGEGTYMPETKIILDKARFKQGGACTLIANDAIGLFEERKGFRD